MASKDRIKRLKDQTRMNILDASLSIVKEEGWQSLSMRKIADAIEYTAPIIYDYFSNKEAILLELTRRGYFILARELQKARKKQQLPAKQLKEMWLAYWDFAFANQDLYRLMFGVEMNSCCDRAGILPESQKIFMLFSEVIIALMNTKAPSDDTVSLKFYAFWAVVHGLISINILKRGHSDEVNDQVLDDGISNIIQSIQIAS